MNIIVCIKQVPDTTKVKIDPETNTLVREGVKSIINPFDMYALEEAIRTKEKVGGNISVLTMGPPQAAEALREAIAMGVDDVYLLSDRAFAGADTLATSYTLSKGIEKIEQFDLIICGKQTIDGDTGQVGPEVAQKLGIPVVTYVSKIENIKNGQIKLKRMVEDGYEVIEAETPLLITVVKEINEPRMPSLRGTMKAKKAEIPTWNANDIGAESERAGLSGSPTQVVRIFAPEISKKCEILEGEPTEIAEKLIKKLKKGKVI
ncbi:electron transfer flavoprotein subunit beta/FixA family protein [Candidatus Oleimmundimicrobium sp.]|uniref:electron transfer flavoprotein subunit beta/FixA family protein n=1 Tax=Candidatus Oleimmundimicrobium sp. TaxID=3060597 RepID=UPI002723A366|nr:electron transfer flavoprotein subunit beta/FixA family protein [Candidatus Oleimmundimicrobium sp.]MDO8885351.1 electron transfer flavoprotein subunit beta/FixA family protein [Candidatus Oleimmundimicrobium sp.]